MADAKIDNNGVRTLLAVSSSDGVTPVVVYADPVTHRLLTQATASATHAMLSATHSDSTAASVVRGDIMTGQGATPKWTRLAIGTAGKVLISDGNDVAWSTSALGTAAYVATTAFEASGAVATHAALLTGVHGLAITAGKVLTVQDNVTITGALGTMAYVAATDYVAKALFDAHTILYATTDNTPAALTVTEQTLVGRVTGGNIAAIAIDSDLSSVSANDDTVPSAKATKAMGDTKLPLAGGTMTGDIQLGENTSLALDPAGSADGKYSGITITGVSGYSQAFGDLVTLDKDDSRWEAVDISVAAAATGDARGIMGMVVSAGTDGNACKILLQGQIRADANFPALTIGAAVYASTSGDIVVAQPTTTDYVIRIVGYALTADEIYFNPDNVWTTHT